LQSIASRPAKVGDKLETRNFGTGTTGFCSTDDINVAVCVLPGTEIAFEEEPVANHAWSILSAWRTKHKVAIFRQVSKESTHAHHDALEFPDGEVKLLTSLSGGMKATVLQLPAAPKTEAEKIDQTRVAFAG
jgi:hypothetical protein